MEVFLERLALLRLVSGRVCLVGLMLRAFLRLEVHHNSRSSGMELFELLELLMDGEAEDVDRSFSFSRAILSFRSPTFSVSGSVQDRSAENMIDGGDGRSAESARCTKLQ
jgi:hypothetical protein